MLAKFAKVKDYFAKLLIILCLLMGLVYAVITTYQTSYELKHSKKQYEDSLKVIEKQYQNNLELLKEQYQNNLKILSDKLQIEEVERKSDIAEIKNVLNSISENTELTKEKMNEIIMDMKKDIL